MKMMGDDEDEGGNEYTRSMKEKYGREGASRESGRDGDEI
jgi:hypothetical protein